MVLASDKAFARTLPRERAISLYASLANSERATEHATALNTAQTFKRDGLSHFFEVFHIVMPKAMHPSVRAQIFPPASQKEN